MSESFYLARIVGRPTENDSKEDQKTAAGGMNCGFLVRRLDQDCKDIDKKDLLRAKVINNVQSPDLFGIGTSPMLPIGTTVLCCDISGVPHILGTSGIPFGTENSNVGNTNPDRDGHLGKLAENRNQTQRLTGTPGTSHNVRLGGSPSNVEDPNHDTCDYPAKTITHT